MKSHQYFIEDDRIHSYVYRDLRGRYLKQSATTRSARRVFLVVYGQHATIERMVPTVEALSQFGDVYLVDTPGFGGMDAPYKIGEEPSLDFYDGHIQNIFDTLLPRDKQITIFATSYGMQLISHFFARHESYQKRVEDIVSFVGLVSHTNFHISKKLERILKYAVCGPGKTSVGAWVYKHIILRDSFLAMYYRYVMVPKKAELAQASPQTIDRYVNEQSWLWRINDQQTHGRTAWDFLFRTDLTTLRIPIDIIHAGVPNDHFLDNDDVVRGLRRIYRRVDAYTIDLHGHAPAVMEDAKDVLEFIPKKLQRKMAQSKN